MDRVHLRSPRLHRLVRVQHGLKHLIGHLDKRGRLPRRRSVFCGDSGEKVAHTPDLFTDGHKPRPVVIEQPIPSVARDIRGGRDGDHTLKRLRG